MKKGSRKHERRKKAAVPLVRFLMWVAAAAGVGLFLYGVSQTAGVAYDEDDIRVVSFSALSSSEQRNALRTANRARCTCGCGMNLAQCVSTDMTCPVRERNIQTIRTMVQEADEP